MHIEVSTAGGWTYRRLFVQEKVQCFSVVEAQGRRARALVG